MADYYVGPVTYIVERGATSVILHVPICDSSRLAMSGVAYNTAGLAGRWVSGGATESASLSFEDVTTLGTYQAPSTGNKVRIKEVDATDMEGVYELHLHNDWFATGRYIYLILRGVTGMAQCHVLIQLTGANLNDGVRAGLAALPNAAVEATGGLFTRGSGTGRIYQAADGMIDVNVVRIANTTQSASNLAGDIADVAERTNRLPDTPAAAGSAMTLVNDAITAAKFDESTAYPLKQTDSGSTAVARTGADGDTLETISDQLDAAGVVHVYRGRIYYREDAGNNVDQYTGTWEKDGEPVAAVDISAPTIEVRARSTGLALIAETNMEWDAESQMLRYDGVDSERNSAAEVLLVIVRATLDGATRVDCDLLGRDM